MYVCMYYYIIIIFIPFVNYFGKYELWVLTFDFIRFKIIYNLHLRSIILRSNSVTNYLIIELKNN